MHDAGLIFGRLAPDPRFDNDRALMSFSTIKNPSQNKACNERFLTLQVNEGLDAIIDCHEGYVTGLMDRCFLNPKEKVMKNTVGRVLDLCVQLHNLCDNFCSAFSAEVDSKEEFSKEDLMETKVRGTLISSPLFGLIAHPC